MIKKMYTSESHPLRIDAIPVGEQGGLIGVTLCPGKYQHNAISGDWNRSLALDVAAIRQWGANLVISLIEDAEFSELRVEKLPDMLREANVEWMHMPIADYAAPNLGFDLRWETLGPQVQARLNQGERILVHCKGGLGRAGTIAAKLLIERGISVDEAMQLVRKTRSPEAIQTTEQEQYLQRLARR